jgi:hypothetical protein
MGAYEPRWFTAAHHMNPDDPVQAMGFVGARQVLGYHWETFQLTDEAVDRPAFDPAEALARRRIPAGRLLAMRPGLRSGRIECHRRYLAVVECPLRGKE